jgi:hypothetical protein
MNAQVLDVGSGGELSAGGETVGEHALVHDGLEVGASQVDGGLKEERKGSILGLKVASDGQRCVRCGRQDLWSEGQSVTQETGKKRGTERRTGTDDGGLGDSGRLLSSSAAVNFDRSHVCLRQQQQRRGRRAKRGRRSVISYSIHTHRLVFRLLPAAPLPPGTTTRKSARLRKGRTEREGGAD